MKNTKIFGVFLVIAGMALAAVMLFAGNQSDNQTAQVGSKFAEPVTELKIEDLVVGTGREAVPGTAVTVHYTGWLTNGTKFDSSLDKGIPFQFPLGFNYVIKGWDQGLIGMKEGGKRKLAIPPSLAYGKQRQGPIPPNSALIFEVELIKVEGVVNPEQQ